MALSRGKLIVEWQRDGALHITVGITDAAPGEVAAALVGAVADAISAGRFRPAPAPRSGRKSRRRRSPA